MKLKLFLIVIMSVPLCSTYKQYLSGEQSINPTGSYKLVSKTKVRNGDTYGYFGEINVKLLDSSRIAISFFVCKGAPGYNLGSFVDTLEFVNNSAVYKTEDDSTCIITFKFLKKGIDVDEKAGNYNNGCGFGHAVVARGFFKKISANIPEIKDPLLE